MVNWRNSLLWVQYRDKYLRQGKNHHKNKNELLLLGHNLKIALLSLTRFSLEKRKNPSWKVLDVGCPPLCSLMGFEISFFGHKRSFNNYVERGKKMSVFCPRSGYKNCPRKGGGVKKWQNSVHVVVEWPQSWLHKECPLFCTVWQLGIKVIIYKLRGEQFLWNWFWNLDWFCAVGGTEKYTT